MMFLISFLHDFLTSQSRFNTFSTIIYNLKFLKARSVSDNAKAIEQSSFSI